MAWNGSGAFTRGNGVYTGASVWQQDAAAEVDIEADRHDTHDQDLAAGINACLAKNGENAMTGDLNMGSHDIVNAGAASFTSVSIPVDDAAEVSASVTPSDYQYSVGDIRRYGALSGDVAHEAVNDAALADAALVAAQGIAIFIPEGIFWYSDTWVLPRVIGLTVQGMGVFSVLKYTGSANAVELDTSTITNIRKMDIGGFMIDCTSGSPTGGLILSNAATGNGFSWSHVHDLYIYGTTEADSIGLGVYFGFNSEFSNIIVRDFDTCYYFDSDEVNIKRTTNLVLNKLVAVSDDCYAGIVFDAGTWGMTALSCTVEGDGMRYGFFVEGRLADTTERHVFVNCGGEDDQVVALWWLENCKQISFQGMISGTSTTGSGVILKNCSGIEFENIYLGEYDGDVTGTAQAGAASTITLASGASAIDDDYYALVIETTGGTGSGQTRQINDYVGSTKVATVSPDWDVTPDNTTEYSIKRLALAAASNSPHCRATGYLRDARGTESVYLGNLRWDTKWEMPSLGTTVRKMFGGSISRPWYEVTASPSSTINVQDLAPQAVDPASGAVTLIPAAITADNEGVELEVWRKSGSANGVVIDPSSTETIGGDLSLTLQHDNEAVLARSDLATTDWKIISHYNPHPYATVASASSLTIPKFSQVVLVTGTTGITSISATGHKGHTVRLIFADVLTVTDGSNLKLAGNFTTSADDVLTLVCDGTNWYEAARSAN